MTLLFADYKKFCRILFTHFSKKERSIHVSSLRCSLIILLYITTVFLSRRVLTALAVTFLPSLSP